LHAIVVLSIIGSYQSFLVTFKNIAVLNDAAQFAEKGGFAAAPGLAKLCGFLAFMYWITGVVFVMMLLVKHKRFFMTFLIYGVAALVYFTVLVHLASYIIPGFQFLSSPILVITTFLIVVELIMNSLYFVNSKRVRIYMGSDDYLKVNPFAKLSNRNPEDNAEPTRTTATTTAQSPSGSDS